MTRHLRLIRLFWSTSLLAEMEYRVNFVLASLASIGGLAGSIFAMSLFFRPAKTLGGWTWAEALIVLALFTIFEGFSAAILSPNLNRIVQHVRGGTLDYVLLKPIDSQFWLSARNFSPWGLPNVVFGVGLLIYAAIQTQAKLANILLAMAPIALGLLVLYSIWFLIASLSVWFVKVWNATEVLRSFIEAGRLPVQAYPLMLQLFFTFVIPVAFLTTVPAQAMLGKVAMPWLLGAFILAFALFIASRKFWFFALRYYTSASS